VGQVLNSHGPLPFLALDMRVEVGRLIGAAPSLRVTIDLGDDPDQGRRMRPCRLRTAVSHQGKFAEGERSGVETEDTRKLPNESIKVFATESTSSALILISCSCITRSSTFRPA